MSVSVCLSVCLSDSIYQKRQFQISRNFLYRLHVAVARFSADDRHCVMYFRFVVDVMFARNGANPPKSVMTLCLVKLTRWRHWGRCCSVQLQVCFKLRNLAVCGLKPAATWSALTSSVFTVCASVQEGRHFAFYFNLDH